ncbi:hypothetical protein B296_00058651 [Ensete ventricosum]|uniref:Uncharacterized protein n=1 Tax=Ensete ventricosum TaxID=4639 RepID=A0A426X2E9_ENSVE|nr:hypothetical protein B296_00058651 [Ensete ventricosum]
MGDVDTELPVRGTARRGVSFFQTRNYCCGPEAMARARSPSSWAPQGNLDRGQWECREADVLPRLGQWRCG